MADKKPKKFQPVNNPAEVLKSSAREIADVPKQIWDEALTQIGLKPQKKPLMGEISLASGIHKTNQEINQKDSQIDVKLRQLNNVQQKEKEVYSAKQKAVEGQVKQLMEQLAAEVARLEKQTAELTSEVRRATVEVMPVNPGMYHLNFFDWVIGTLRDLRKRVNASRLWLNLWTQKKKQKGYWAMAKKHGDKFMFSDERSVATAAG